MWPEGKELGSRSTTSGSMGQASQGRARSTRGLMVILVISSPSAIAIRAAAPALRVGLYSTMARDRAIHKSPALPNWVYSDTTGSSQGTRRFCTATSSWPSAWSI